MPSWPHWRASDWIDKRGPVVPCPLLRTKKDMQNFSLVYQAFLDRLEKLFIWIASLLVVVLLGNETLGIVYDLFGRSIPWTTELSVCVFAWVVFLGAGILTRRGGLLSLEIMV